MVMKTARLGLASQRVGLVDLSARSGTSQVLSCLHTMMQTIRPNDRSPEPRAHANRTTLKGSAHTTAPNPNRRFLDESTRQVQAGILQYVDYRPRFTSGIVGWCAQVGGERVQFPPLPARLPGGAISRSLKGTRPTTTRS